MTDITNMLLSPIDYVVEYVFEKIKEILQNPALLAILIFIAIVLIFVGVFA